MATATGHIGDYSFMRDAAYRAQGRVSRDRGLITRLFAAFIASREAWARDAVESHLNTLSERELVKLGTSSDDIARLRANVRGRQSFKL